MALSFVYGSHMVLVDPFLTALLYIKCQKNPEQVVRFWGIPIKSAHFPWAFMAFHMLMGGDPIIDLIGIAAGHAYIFAREVLPRSHGYRPLDTPRWLKNFIQRHIYDKAGRPRFEAFAGGHRVHNPDAA
jgi:Derlin-2/3